MTFLKLGADLLRLRDARSGFDASYDLVSDPDGATFAVRWHDGHVTGVSAELDDELQAASVLPHLDYVVTDALTCRHVERLLEAAR